MQRYDDEGARGPETTCWGAPSHDFYLRPTEAALGRVGGRVQRGPVWFASRRREGGGRLLLLNGPRSVPTGGPARFLPGCDAGGGICPGSVGRVCTERQGEGHLVEGPAEGARQEPAGPGGRHHLTHKGERAARSSGWRLLLRWLGGWRLAVGRLTQRT